MNFFNDCKTQDEAKTLFRKLSKMFHPDKGGDPEFMMELKKQYDDFHPSFGYQFNRINQTNPDDEIIAEYKKYIKRSDEIIDEKNQYILRLENRVLQANQEIDDLKAGKDTLWKMSLFWRILYVIFGDKVAK
jgi:hemerythrin-like domain-containing protein